MSRKSVRFLWLLLVAVPGCERPTFRFRELADVSRIIVAADYGYDTVAVITEPARIALLVDFVNARHDKWEVPWDGIPGPRVQARFQSTTGPRETYFGGGIEYFTSDINGFSATRDATMDETLEFARLTGVPIDAFRPKNR
jgi:hypothetical protein